VQSGQTVQTTVGAVTAQTTFLQTGTGAVLRSGLSKMQDIINAKDFGAVGDGVADDSDALQRAITATAGRTLVLTGTFRVTKTLTISASNTHILGQGVARIVADPEAPWATGQVVLEARGPGPLASTSLTAPITAASTNFTVASAANMTPGRFIQISSNQISGTYARSSTLITVTSNNHGVPNGASIRLQFNTGTATTNTYVVTVVDANTFTCNDTVSGTTSGNVVWFEYWSGIVGDSGFQPIPKKELNCVRSVSGSVVTPEWGFADTYSLTGYAVTVTPYQFIENIKIENVEFYGPGGGGTGLLSGPAAVKAIYVEDFAFSNCVVENFLNTAVELEFTHNTRVTNNQITGRNLADPSNLPTISVWFYGVVYNGSTEWVFSNNTCQYLRRAMDAGGTSGYPISRNGVVSNNTAISCQNGYGSHFTQNVVFSNNQAVKCNSGIFYRGKDAVIVGNSLEATGVSPSSAAISFGSDPGIGVAYTDNPSSGRITIADNFLKTTVVGLYFRVNVDSAVIEGNTIFNGNSHGIFFEGKQTQDVIISNNSIDLTNRTAARYGIYTFNKYDYCELLKNITISGNRLKNTTESIRIEAPLAVEAAATNIIIKNNTVDAGSTPGGTQRGLRLSKGAFGKNIVFRDNLYGDPTLTGGIAPGVTLDLTAANNFEVAPDIGDNAFWDYNQQVISFAASTALQTKLVTAVGQRIINSAPAPGGYMGWVCTSAGVVGALATVNGGAVTGDITSGTDQLAVSSLNNASIFVGAYLTIAGAGVAGADLKTRVTAVNGLVVTVADNASTTVIGVAVTYTNPVFKGFGLIQV
jgi:hypothetical protein